jgi:hypothetical protein
MGIRIVWDDEAKTIIRYIFDAVWTWDDFFNAKAEAYALIDTVQHKVGIIMDGPSDLRLPANMLTHSRSALRNKHPNTSVIAAVIHKPFLRIMFNTLINLTKGDDATIHLVSTVDEARQLIADRLRRAPGMAPEE